MYTSAEPSLLAELSPVAKPSYLGGFGGFWGEYGGFGRGMVLWRLLPRKEKPEAIPGYLSGLEASVKVLEGFGDGIEAMEVSGRI